MNLHNLSQEEFDEKIKGHLDDSNVPFDPASWNKMSRKLDLAFPDTGSGNGRMYELLIVALLLSTLFFWNVGSFSNTGSGEVNMNDKIQAQVADNLDVNNSTQLNLPESTTTQSSETGLDRPQTIEQEEGASSTYSTKNKASASDSKPNNPVVSQQVSKDSAPKNPSQSKSGRSVVIDENIATSDPINSEPQVMFIPEKSSTGSLIHPLAGFGVDVMLLPEEGLPDSIQQVKLLEDAVVPIVQSKSAPWSLGFGYAPDISLVGFGETTNPGTNLSIIAEYQLGRRWSIQSGLTYSMKKYKATGDDYNPPKGFWYYGVAPDDTDAACDVLDIPLNVRYYFNPSKLNRFFASTGLSSYIMLTEDYYYHYDHNYNPNLVDSWSVSNENQHFFSIYNFSFGYQMSIGSGWFLEVEPFIKVPLGGVGFGEVELWSTGSFFSLKYNFK